MPRPRLFAGPEKAGSFRMALVSAPAGSGKTTLLSDWYRDLRERRLAAAWLSIDDLDNDPRRFLAHLVAALQAELPGLGREVLDLLAANPDALMEDAATSLVQAFAGTDPRIVLFLDDYHEIRDRNVHAVMEYLLRYLPPDVRFVVGTRRDPPLSVACLRMQGKVLDIRWEDLRFDVDEARNYFREVCRLDLSEDQVRALCARTEGWIAGLQLAAMTVAAEGDAGRFVDSFSGVRKDVADYLLEGVFRRLPAGMRNYLMRTSILERMCASLCDALTGRQDGRHMMETLEKGNLFVVGLDDSRTWYRYHQLFSEFLRNRLRVRLPEEVAGLHDRASEWFERNGFPEEAVRYAIAGHRFARAARLIETAGRELFRRGDFKELRRWVDALPEGTVRRSPVLCALHAWALAYLGEFEGARRRIDGAEAAIDGTARPSARGNPPAAGAVKAELQVLRAVLGIIRTDEPDISGLHPGIVSLFPREESALRGYASITLGFASRVAGYLTVALRHFHDALVEAEGGNTSLVNLNARLNIGIVNYLMGRMNDAEASFRRSLDVAAERLWLRSLGAAFLRYGLALVLHEKNRLAEARDELSEGIAFLEAGHAFGFLGMALVERARNQFALGRPDLAGADLEQARAIARKHNVERVSFRADLLEARVAVQAEDLVRAAEFLDSAGAVFGGEEPDDPPVLPEKVEYHLTERIRLLLARGRYDEAVRLAGKGLQSAGRAGRGRNIVEFLALQSAAWNGLSDRDKALSRLEQAVVLARGEGIVRPFVNAGREMIPLLRRLRGREGIQEAAAVLLAALEDQADPRAGKPPSGRDGESFHQRELQILNLISQGFRNREIGKRLFLSEETVKWYLKRLFCKLYVGTRTEAIARARELGLFSIK
jgi:LuxR family maltose regulon positive regulatory protein